MVKIYGMICQHWMEDILSTLWPTSHAMINMTGMDPDQGLVKLQEPGTWIHLHVI